MVADITIAMQYCTGSNNEVLFTYTVAPHFRTLFLITTNIIRE